VKNSPFKRRPLWRHRAFLAGLALIPILMVTVDGPLSSMMRNIDGEAKAVIDLLAESGDSKYSLVPTGVTFLVLMAAYFLDTNTLRARMVAWVAAASGFIFVSIAYSGILINVIKILLGRARPHVADSLMLPELHPFAVSGSWHSSPSGHANTVFAIAFAVGFLVPRLRGYLIVLAAGLAFCRVLQFRHFISDSLGGALLALATTLWLRDLFARNEIVFRRRKDGRVTFTAPGRLVVRWLRRRTGLQRYRSGGTLAFEAAGGQGN
jgi:membrane-associated phospholipid phosphatase